MRSSLNPNSPYARMIDPVRFVRLCWPDIYLTDYQREIMWSVQDNDDTIVTAGNELGKDFVAALIVLWFFVAAPEDVRILTTSADGEQLEGVLWGEMRRFIQSSKVKLPILVNHLHLRKIVNGQVSGRSYVRGRVAEKGEGMLGHHAPYTLFVADEASGVEDINWDGTDTWAKRRLAIGNPWECSNFFKHSIKGKPGTEDRGGDILRDPKDPSQGYYRKVLRIKAEQSPNVRYALAQQTKGLDITGETLVLGVKSWAKYQKDRMLWDPIKQCVGLDGEFYEGGDVLMFPPQWLNRAEDIDRKLKASNAVRRAKAIGIDPAEGGDKTSMTAVDELGIIEMVSKKTPDTAVITAQALAFMRKHGVAPEYVMFDRGGGGKQHADRMREQGYNVRTVAFGETMSMDLKRGIRLLEEKKEHVEEKYIYKNRRAEMYWRLRELIDPAINPRGFGIPLELVELRRQLAPIPLKHDDEGRIYLLPKNKKSDNSTLPTLTELLGCSPDEADSLVIALYCLKHVPHRNRAGFAS